MDLLIRSNGRMHQRWHVAAGKLRAKSMSISYVFSGRYAIRVLSVRIFSALSTGRIFLSPSSWMKGSITPLGEAKRSGVDQHESKSGEVMILPSTKTLCIAPRPSSRTPGVALLSLFAIRVAFPFDDGSLTAGAVPPD